MFRYNDSRHLNDHSESVQRWHRAVSWMLGSNPVGMLIIARLQDRDDSDAAHSARRGR